MFFRILPAAAVSLFLLCFHVFAAPGDIDPTFGIGGRSLLPVGKVSVDRGRAAALQPDGKIVVIGDSISDGQFSLEPSNLLITRVNPDGSLDSSFGIGGMVVKRLRMHVVGASVAIQADGKIVVGGWAAVDAQPTVSTRVFLLVRLLANGSADSSFGSAGVVTSILDPLQHTTLTSIALQSDGKIVATGFAGTGATIPHSLVVATI